MQRSKVRSRLKTHMLISSRMGSARFRTDPDADEGFRNVGPRSNVLGEHIQVALALYLLSEIHCPCFRKGSPAFQGPSSSTYVLAFDVCGVYIWFS